MNASLNQYLTLAHEQRDSLYELSIEPLNALRADARRILENTGLPKKGEEDFERTDLNEMLAPDFGINVRRVPLWKSLSPSACSASSLGIVACSVVGDNAAPITAKRDDGVIVSTFAHAWHSHSHILKSYYGKAAQLSHPATALNTLLAQDGLLVYVPHGVKTEKPVQIVNYLAGSQAMLAVRRVLIVADDDSQVRVLCCDHSLTEQLSGALQVVEIFAGRNAQIDFYDLEETHSNAKRCSMLYAKQSEASNVLIDGITLLNGTTRNEFFIDIDAQQCTTQLLGMAIATGKQHIDNHTLITHNAPHCQSNEMFKYLLDDNATAAFAGKILVKPNCPKVEAYQGNRNLCASPTARMFTKPQLEIYTDDVRCSHGATIGQLDEEALFYMLTRGIGRDTARTLLMQAFMSDVVDSVRLPLLRERLRVLVEHRLAGGLKRCDACAASNKQCAKANNITQETTTDT